MEKASKGVEEGFKPTVPAAEAAVPIEASTPWARRTATDHWLKLREKPRADCIDTSSTASSEGHLVSVLREEMATFMGRVDAHFERQTEILEKLRGGMPLPFQGDPSRMIRLKIDAGSECSSQPSSPLPRGSKRTSISQQILHFKTNARKAAKDEERKREEVLEESHFTFRQKVKRDLLESKYFEMFLAAVVILNVVMIGFEVEMTSWAKSSEAPIIFTYANWVFTITYSLEGMLKLIVLGPFNFCCGKEWAWNVLDTIIVLCSWADIITSLLLSDAGMVSTGQLRIMRIIRVARLLRAVRVAKMLRMFSSLKTLLVSITETLRSMFWTAVLLTLIFYGLSVCFAQSVADHCREVAMQVTGSVDAVPECTNPEMMEYWGSLGESMLTLYKSLSGGLSWHVCLRSLREASTISFFVFLVYIAFGYYVILNVVTGIFCNSAIESARLDKDVAIAVKLKQKETFMSSLRSFFQDIDNDGSDHITIVELEKAIQDREMQALFEAMDIETSDVWSLFALMDADSNGRIDIGELVDGCMRYKGMAKAMHIAKLATDISHLKAQSKGLQADLSKMLWAMRLS